MGRLARAWQHKHRNLWLWVTLAVICVAYFWFHYLKYRGGGALYQHAAQCMWRDEVLQACEREFTYPPFFAFVFLPSIAMPHWLLLAIWFFITVASAIGCCIMVERITLPTFTGSWSERDRELLRLVGIFVSLKFILAVFENQSFDLLALPALLLGVLALQERRDMVAGASIAAAAALKVTPLLFLPYLIFKRRFIGAAAFAVTLALLSFLPDLFFHPAGHVSYFADWLHDVAVAGITENAAAAPHPFWTGANPFNMSIRGALGLMLDGTPYQDHFVLWLRLAQLAFASVITALLLVSYRKDMVSVDSAILVIAMLMLSPMSSRDHFVLLLLPYYLIVAGAMRDQRTPVVGIACLVVSFICTGIPREIVPRAYSEFMRMHSDAVYGTSLLLVYLGAMVRSPARFGISRPKALPDQSPVMVASAPQWQATPLDVEP